MVTISGPGVLLHYLATYAMPVIWDYFFLFLEVFSRRDIPIGVSLDLSTPTGMTCIVTVVENGMSAI